MNKHTSTACVTLGALMCAASAATAQELVTNGGFESGFSGWARADQVGGDGTFLHQSGAASPVNGFAVPTPPQGLHAAMTDSGAPGSHVLYQDFVVPLSVPQATVRFSWFVRNAATAFSTPASLDWATPALNQQARVDIVKSGADPFSTAPADVLLNLLQTAVGSPLVTGYNDFSLDITAFLAAHAGETLRLRFAEVDNVNFFNFGVDAVSLTVPAPSAVALLGVGLAGFAGRRRNRS